jgi:hypothetical protein
MGMMNDVRAGMLVAIGFAVGLVAVPSRRTLLKNPLLLSPPPPATKGAPDPHAEAIPGPEELRDGLRRAGLEKESDRLNAASDRLTTILVAWYTFYFGFVVGAMAWSVTRCFDVNLKFSNPRPLYITGVFNLIQVALGIVVTRKVHGSLRVARTRDADIIADLLNPVPRLIPGTAIPGEYGEGVGLMLLAQVSIFLTILILFCLTWYRLL